MPNQSRKHAQNLYESLSQNQHKYGSKYLKLGKQLSFCLSNCLALDDN